jgi:c-di-GMP-binding flagellar brake protein YcgR
MDISIGGLSLQTEKRLNIGSAYSLKIESRGNAFTLKGSVVWSFLNESIKDAKGNIVPLYTIGMKFTDTSKEQTETIVSFIETHRKDETREADPFSSNGRRMYVRIRIKTPDQAFINYQEAYKLKNISLGGMLIESEHELEIESVSSMEMLLPNERSVKFQGRVVSCFPKKEALVPSFDIGIHFLHMTEENKPVLEEFIKLLDAMEDETQLL